MSLINDALKRANQAQRKQPVAGPLGVPLHSTEPAKKPFWGPLVFIGAALVLVVGVGGGLIALGMRAFRSAPPPLQSNATPPAQVAVVTSPKPAFEPSAKPIAPKPTEPVPEPTVSQPPQPVVSAKTAPREPVTPPPAPRPEVVAVAVPTKVETTRPVARAAPAISVEQVVPRPPDPVPVPNPQPIIPAPVPTIAQTNASPAPAPAAPKVEWPEIVLSGIFYSPTRPAAIVNGKKVGVGSSVTGLKVIAIERDSVTLELQGEKKVVYFQ